MSDTKTSKFDWVKSDLNGASGKIPELYQEGIRPEHFRIDPRETVWQNPEVQEKFKDYGDKAEEAFNAFYDNSVKRYDAFSKDAFDVTQVEARKFLPTRDGLKIAQGTGGTVMRFANPVDDEVILAQQAAKISGGYWQDGQLKGAKRSVRQAAMDNNMVLTKDNVFVSKDEFEGNATVTAMNEDGSYKFDENGMPYIRELADGEEKKSYEEYANWVTDWLGYNRINSMNLPEALAKGLIKNPMNLAIDTLNGLAEMAKQMDTGIGFVGDMLSDTKVSSRETPNSEFYNAMTNFQNFLGQGKIASTDETNQTWYTAEGLVDGISQVVGQLALMVGTGGTVGGLARMAGMSKGVAGALGSNSGRLLLSTMAAAPLAEEMRTMGASKRETAALYSGLVLGLTQINKLSEMVTGTSPLLINSVIKKVIKDSLKGGVNFADDKLAMIAGKRLAKEVGKIISNKPLMMSYLGAAATESAEESAELVYELSLKEAYDKIYQPYFADSELGKTMETDPNVRFDYDWSQFGTELTQSAVLGAVGGTIGKAWLDRTGVTKKDILYLVKEGKVDQLERKLAKMRDAGALGETYLNAKGDDIQPGEMSRNELAYMAVKQQIEATKALWDDAEVNRIVTENKKVLTDKKAALLRGPDYDTVIGNSVANRYADTISEINEIREEIGKNNDGSQELTEKLNRKVKELDKLKSGEMAYDLYKEAIYNVPGKRTKLGEFFKVGGISYEAFNKLNGPLKGEFKTDYSYPNVEQTIQDELDAGKFLSTTVFEGKIARGDVDRYKQDIRDLAARGIIPESEVDNFISVTENALYDAPRETTSFDTMLETMAGTIPTQVQEELKRMYANTPAKKGFLSSRADSFLNGFDDDYNTTAPFIYQIADELKRKNDLEINKTGIYDNPTNADRIFEQANNRLEQILALKAMRGDMAKAAEVLEVNPEEVENIPDDDVLDSLASQIAAIADIANSLAHLAKENKGDFVNIYNTVNTEASREYYNSLNTLYDVMGQNIKIEEGGHLISPEIFKAIDANPSIGNIQLLEDQMNLILNDSGQFEAILRQLKTKYKTAPELAGYAKMLKDFTGKQLNSVYNSILVNREIKENIPESGMVPSKEQLFVARRAAAFLAGSKDETSENENYTNLDTGLFLRGYQGSGKTLTTAFAVRMAELLAGEGQTLVLANDIENRNKMKNTIEAIGGHTVSNVNATWEDINSIENALVKDKTITTIVIDEATLMDMDDVKRLHDRLTSINKDSGGHPVRVLFTGDGDQIGATKIEKSRVFQRNVGHDYVHSYVNKGEDNVPTPQYYTLERTKETKFSFRSGNSSIVGFLEDLRIIKHGAMQDASVRSNHAARPLWKKNSGVRIENEDKFNTLVDSTVADFLKEGISSFVIITDFSRKEKYLNKQFNGQKLNAGQILTPKEAQGKQWKHVIIDVNYMGVDSGFLLDMALSELLSAAGRAKNSILMKRDNSATGGWIVPLDFQSSEDKMDLIEENNIEVNDEISQTLRDAAIGELREADLDEIEFNTRVVSKEIIGGREVSVIKTQSNLMDNKQAKKVVQQTQQPEAKEEPSVYYQLSTFFTQGYIIDVDDEIAIDNVGTIMQIKKAILYPEYAKNLYDKVKLRIVVEDFEPGSSRFYSDKRRAGGKGKHMVVHADLYTDGTRTHDVVLGAIPRLTERYANAKVGTQFDLDEKNSEFLLNTIRDGSGNSDDITNHVTYNETRKGELGKTPNVLEEPIPFDQFKEDGSFYGYSSVFSPSQANVEKVPYVAYSPVMDTQQLDNIIKDYGDSFMNIQNGTVSFSMNNLNDDQKERLLNTQGPVFFLKLDEIHTAQRLDSYIEGLLDKSNDDQLSKSQNNTIREFMKLGEITDDELRSLFKKQKGYLDLKDKSGNLLYRNRVLQTMAFVSMGKTKFNWKEGLKKLYRLSQGFKQDNNMFKQAPTDGDIQAAQELLGELAASPGFKEGVRLQGKVKKVGPKSRLNFRDAPDTDFQIGYKDGIDMPVYKISGRAITQVLENDGNKISTLTKSVTTKVKEIAPTKETPQIKASGKIINPKRNDGEEKDTDQPYEFTVPDDRPFYSLTNVMSTYFKNDSGRFVEFIAQTRRELYQSLFQLEVADTSVVTDSATLNAGLKSAKKSLEGMKKIVDGMSDTDRQLLLDSPSTAAKYYQYVLSKEFEFLIPEIMSGISFDNKTKKFGFKESKFSLNNEYEEREMQSLLARQNELLKMHFFNTRIIARDAASRQGNMYFSDTYLTMDSMASILNEIRDLNITADDDWENELFFNKMMSNDVSPELESLYYHIFSPNPYQVKVSPTSIDTKVEMHSFTSYMLSLDENNAEQKIIKDNMIEMLTAFKSFLKSGTVKSLISYDQSENRLNARLSNFKSSSFSINVEDALKNAARIHSDTESKSAFIYEAKTDGGTTELIVRTGDSPKIIRFDGNGDYLGTEQNGRTLKNDDSFVRAMLELFRFTGIGTVNKMALDHYYARKLKIGDDEKVKKLQRVFKDMVRYVATGNGGEPQIFNSRQLTDFKEIIDEIRVLRQGEGAFQTTNVNGDKVSNIALSAPAYEFNSVLQQAAESAIFQANPFVGEDSYLTVEEIGIRDGFKDDFGGKSVTNLDLVDQINFDIMKVFAESVIKNADTRVLGKKDATAYINPLTFSDKGQSLMTRITGELFPDKAGKLDTATLEKRYVEYLNKYYTEVAKGIIQRYSNFFGRDFASNSTAAIAKSFGEINTLLQSGKQDVRRGNLFTTLDYISKEGVLQINPDILPKIQNTLKFVRDGKKSFDEDIEKLKGDIMSLPNYFEQSTGLSEQDFLDAYYYNTSLAGNAFSHLMVGPTEQYKNYQDKIKRASQVLTNRYHAVLRSKRPDISVKEALKLSEFSQTAIVTDFKELKEVFDYIGADIEVFDGAAFHNEYSLIQLRESYGQSYGFPVSSTFKPISSYMDMQSGVSRSDKYASFEITQTMKDKGAPFIKALRDKMLSSVPFPEVDADGNTLIVKDVDGQPLMLDGAPVDNFLELEQAMKEKYPNADAEQIMDVAARNNVQDYYLNEIIFTTGVKTGASNINVFESMDEFANDDEDGRQNPLIYQPRANRYRGVVLNSEKDTENAKGTIPTQIISAMLQDTASLPYAMNILSSLAKIAQLQGESIADELANKEGALRALLRKKAATREDIGFTQQLIEMLDFSFNNPSVTRLLKSALSSEASEGISFDIAGGSQIVAPGNGVWKVRDTENGPIIDNTELNVKNNVKETFKENPSLAKIGTEEQYSRYLDTIFPDSKVKDIVYHGSPSGKIEKFDTNKVTSGAIYFTPVKDEAEGYAMMEGNKGKVTAVLLNSNKVKYVEGAYFASKYDKESIDLFISDLLNPDKIKLVSYGEQDVVESFDTQAEADRFMKENSGWEKAKPEDISNAIKFVSEEYDTIETNIEGRTGGIFAVFEPEQIHILGNKQDIQGFKQFVSKDTPPSEPRDLKGFNAFRKNEKGKVTKESILNTPEWELLKTIVDSRIDKTKKSKYSKQDEIDAREAVFDLMVTEDWEIQLPEVVVSPIHYSKFGIARETALEEVTPEFLSAVNSEKFIKRFKRDKAARAAVKQDLAEFFKLQGEPVEESLYTQALDDKIELEKLTNISGEKVDVSDVFEGLESNEKTVSSVQRMITRKYEKYEALLDCLKKSNV